MISTACNGPGKHLSFKLKFLSTVKRMKNSEKWRWELTSLRKKNENKNTQNTQKRTKKALIQQTP